MRGEPRTTAVRTTITQVPFGGIEIEGLLLENGEFAIAVPQVCELFQFLTKNAIRDLKTLLGKDFQFLKARTVLNPKAVNILSIEDFVKVIRKLDRAGNIQAEKLTDALVGVSLHQLFSDAFGIKFEKDERQAYLKARLPGKVTRRAMTDSIRDWLERHSDEISDNTRKFIYSNVSDCLNRAVFNKSASQLCEERKCEKEKLRDTHDDKELKKIDSHEEFTMKLIDKFDRPPLEAMKEAIEFYQ